MGPWEFVILTLALLLTNQSMEICEVLGLGWTRMRQLLMAWQSASVGKKKEESLDGGSSLFILDAMVGKEYGSF